MSGSWRFWGGLRIRTGIWGWDLPGAYFIALRPASMKSGGTMSLDINKTKNRLCVIMFKILPVLYHRAGPTGQAMCPYQTPHHASSHDLGSSCMWITSDLSYVKTIPSIWHPGLLRQNGCWGWYTFPTVTPSKCTSVAINQWHIGSIVGFSAISPHDAQKINLLF